jgi:hypothetical protein
MLLNVAAMTTLDIRELHEGWNLILFLYNDIHSGPEFHLVDHCYSIQTFSVSAYFSFSGLYSLTKDLNALRAVNLTLFTRTIALYTPKHFHLKNLPSNLGASATNFDSSSSDKI